MLNYEISSWRSTTALNGTEHATRKRLDAGLAELYRQIYDMLSADGALDTLRGWRLVREFDAFAERLKREPLARGFYRREIFRLRESDQLGAYVEFRQAHV